MVVPDTAGTGRNVADGVDLDQTRAFQQRAMSSRAHLGKALNARFEETSKQHLCSALNVEAR